MPLSRLWITITLRGIGEMHGDRLSAVPNPTTSWIDLSPFESDEFGVPRAYVQLALGPGDAQTWPAMAQAALVLAQAVAASPAKIQYLSLSHGADDTPWHAGDQRAFAAFPAPLYGRRCRRVRC
jgi:hypothetical protein